MVVAGARWTSQAYSRPALAIIAASEVFLLPAPAEVNHHFAALGADEVASS